MPKYKLSIVIPAYNESQNLLLGSLDKVHNYLKNQKYTYEVLIIDDGSTDETVKIAEEQIKNKKNFKLIKNPHGGKALTVISGILQTSGEIALFMDMDLATPVDQIEKFFPKFEEGYDIVIGSRHGRKGAPIIRKLMGFGFSAVRFIFLGLPFKDTQCGFKAFNRKALEKVFPEMKNVWEKNKVKGAAVNAGFDVELLFIAKKKGFRIAELFVEWHHVGTERVQALNDSFEALRDILRIRINDFKGGYD